MELGFFLVAMATCLASASLVRGQGIQEWNTWPTIRLPKMHAVPLEESIQHDRDKVTDFTARETLEKEKEGNLLKVEGTPSDKETIERSLSFQQTSARNLSDIHRTKVTIDDAKDLLNMNLITVGKETGDNPARSRRKRHIFGADTRYRITKNFQKIFPFSAVTQLSTGCSGILIGPRHVLTAAECIHNGRRYRGSAKNLRVGLTYTANTTSPNTLSPNDVQYDSQRHGLRWFDVDQIYIPDGWVSPSYGEKQASFNYAVLELVENHNLNCMEVGVSSILNTNRMQRIHFSSFDDFEYYPEPVLAYRHCYIVSDTTNYLYEKCDSTKSSAGAGIYLRMWDSENWRWSRRVMAVKTSVNERIRIRGKTARTGKDVRITLLNFGQICYWVMRDFEACSRGRIEDACLMA